jgi:hypothetical protein
MLQAYSTVVAVRQRTSVFLDPFLFAGLKELKARDGVTEAEAIRRAIGEYLTRRGVWSTRKQDASGWFPDGAPSRMLKNDGS